MTIFKHKGPKLDSKVRFQTRDFNKKLEGARGFKRRARSVPESSVFKFFYRFGWISWVIFVTALIVIVLGIYLVYFSNFFRLEKIEIQGGSTEEQAQLNATIRTFVEDRGNLWVPQYNLLVLSKADLTKLLLEKHTALRKGFTIVKKFPRGISLNVDFRKQEFLVGTPRGIFSYFDDGAFIKKNSENSSSFFDDAPGVMKIWAQGEWGDSEIPQIPLETFRSVRRIQSGFFPPSQNTIDFFVVGSMFLQGDSDMSYLDPRVLEIKEEIVANEIAVYSRWNGVGSEKFPRGFKIYLDGNSDIEEDLARTEVVILKRSVDKQRQLLYIDMRFPNRAFLCDVGQPCSLPTAPKVPVVPGTENKEDLKEVPPSQQTHPRG